MAGHREEGLLDIGAVFGTGLEELDAQLVRVFLKEEGSDVLEGNNGFVAARVRGPVHSVLNHSFLPHGQQD